MKRNSRLTGLSKFRNGETLFRNKYNMKTITSLVLDFEMMVENEDYTHQKVQFTRTSASSWNIT